VTDNPSTTGAEANDATTEVETPVETSADETSADEVVQAPEPAPEAAPAAEDTPGDLAAEPAIVVEPAPAPAKEEIIEVPDDPDELAPEPEAEPASESESEPEPEPASEPESDPEAEPAGQPESDPETEPASEPEPGAEPAGEAEPEPAAAPVPAPPKPSAAPSPKMFAARPKPPAAAPVQAHTPSDSARFGRVAEDGTVFVKDGEGERAVGSYPGATDEEALQYFARKYDELYAAADLLTQRAALPEVTSKDLAEGLTGLRTHIGEANVVGDLVALTALVDGVESQITSKRESESAARAAAKAEALTVREDLVAQAEAIAGQPVERIQWKTSSATMRALLDSWKEQQRTGARLDKDVEAALWQRFSRARNSFDKARRTHFAELETTRTAARSSKEKLVKEAQALATSKDWAATAGAFKRLMDQWRQAGRASRAEDDALWEQFKAAQDSFFAAKDAVVAAEDEEYRANLEVKLGLLAEAEKLLPVQDLEATKAALRVIQDKWDAAGKVPRADIDRTEKGMRRVEAAVREADEKKWRRTNPEVTARAQSLATQLEASLAKVEEELAQAQAKGNSTKIADLTAKLEAQRSWLEQARGGLSEIG